MKRFNMLLASMALVLPAAVSRADVKGDYVEARSASVFAGACHYNGELVTTGRDAVLAWNITSGSVDNVELTGVRVVAVVSSKENLSDEIAKHRTELTIDSAATQAQADAVVKLLKEKSAASLGEVVSIKRASIIFTNSDDHYQVSAGENVKLDVSAMPNGECCKQPNNVWYSPLVKLNHQKVGYTRLARYSGGAVTDAWERGDENSAFYGSFEL
jgi:hypothetical protein